MKKICYFIILFCGLLLFEMSVEAKDYTCKYYYDLDEDRGNTVKIDAGTMTVNTSNQSVAFSPTCNPGILLSDDFTKNFFQLHDKGEAVEEDDECPNILICSTSKSDFYGDKAFSVNPDVCAPTASNDSYYYHYIFNDESEKEASTHKLTRCYIMKGIKVDGNNDVDVDLNELDEATIDSCVNYDSGIGSITLYYNFYSECKNDSNCKVSNLNSANNEIEKLKSLCNSVLKHSDYTSPCVNKCLNLSDDIYNLKVEHGIEAGLKGGTCNLSDRIINWIANIMKWIKYIAPVLVIIFGIMDFIKAIASNNDDAMKKAQNRFVKRLIVAALVFIVPFLIEFVINTFGLVSDDIYCKII